MQRIRLAVKCNQRPADLETFMRIAERLDITALEIQEVGNYIASVCLRKRAEAVVDAARGRIQRLCYHQPLWGAPATEEAMAGSARLELASEDNHIALSLAKETIVEAADVGIGLGLELPVLVNFHIIGFAPRRLLIPAHKKGLLERGERALVQLSGFANEYCDQEGFVKNGVPLIKIVRENNYPFYSDEIYGLLDCSPAEAARLSGTTKILNNLDFAHLQLTINYFSAHPTSPRTLLESSYPKTTWDEATDALGKTLALIHINDAAGFTPEREGVAVGLGEVPFAKIIPELCARAPEEIFGTVEIKDHHLKPELFTGSVAELRRIFGRDFETYFC